MSQLHPVTNCARLWVFQGGLDSWEGAKHLIHSSPAATEYDHDSSELQLGSRRLKLWSSPLRQEDRLGRFRASGADGSGADGALIIDLAHAINGSQGPVIVQRSSQIRISPESSPPLFPAYSSLLSPLLTHKPHI